MTALVLALLVYSILSTIAAAIYCRAAKGWQYVAYRWRQNFMDHMKYHGLEIPEGQGMNRSVSQRMGIFARWKFRQEINRLCREIEGQTKETD